MEAAAYREHKQQRMHCLVQTEIPYKTSEDLYAYPDFSSATFDRSMLAIPMAR